MGVHGQKGTEKVTKNKYAAADYCSMSDSAATAEATEDTTATMTATTMTNRPPARRMNMSITSFLNDFLYSIPFFSKNNKQFFGRNRFEEKNFLGIDFFHRLV